MKKYIALVISAAILVSSATFSFAEKNAEPVPETAGEAVEVLAETVEADAADEIGDQELDVMAAVDMISFEYNTAGQQETKREFKVKYNTTTFDTGVKDFVVELRANNSKVTNITAESVPGIKLESTAYDPATRTVTFTGSSASPVVANDAFLTVKVELSGALAEGETVTTTLNGASMISNGTTTYKLSNGGMNSASVLMESISGIDEQLPGENEGVSGSINWRFDGRRKTLILSGHGNMADYSAGEAPWYQEGAGAKIIKHILFEEGCEITSGGAYAFSGLTSVVDVKMPGNLQAIGNHAFDGCTSLSEVDFGKAGGIGAEAFKDCSSLRTVNIPDTVTSIGASAFAGCTSLYEMTVPYIGGQRTSYDKTFGYFFDGNVPSSLKRVIVTNAERVPDNAFKDCTSIEVIAVNNVSEIGVSAFENCSSLLMFDIPTSVTKIADRTFAGCSSASEIVVHSTINSIGTSAFEGCSSLTKINEGNTIPSDVKAMSNSVFKDCSSLVEFVIPETVTSIGTNVLAGCTKLHVLTIPFVGAVDNVTDFSNPVLTQQFGYIFGCKNEDIPAEMTKVIVLNPSVNSAVAPYAFAGCSNIEDINIKGGASVGKCAFENCAALKNLYLPRSVQSIGATILAGAKNLETLVVPFVGQLKNESNKETSVIGAFFGWTDTQKYSYDILQMYNENGDTHFYHVPTTLKNVAVLAQTNVPVGVFAECRSLDKVSFVSGANLGKWAFYDCQYLTDVKLPDNMENIGYQAFAECYKLRSVNIPKGAKTIGEQAFWACESLLELVIPDSVTEISSDAFKDAGTKAEMSELSAMATITIRGKAGSAAEAAAKANGFNFEVLDDLAFDSKSTLTLASDESDGALQLNVTGNESGIAYAALYSSNGAMIAAKQIEKPNGEPSVQLEFSEEERAGAVRAKVFVWDDMRPQTDAEIIPLA